MLFYAIGDRRLCASEAKKGVDYHCPECNGRVRLRGGQIRQLHFYHLQDARSCRQNGKSLTHLRLQKLLASLLSAELEYRFPSIKRIADVYSPKKSLVVEVQCSSISLEEMESRNQDYASLGLRVVWVLLNRRFSNHHFSFTHYFTNGYTLYDRLGKQQFPIDLSHELEMPQKLPYFLKERTMVFSGDLIHRYSLGILPIQKRPAFSLRSLLHLALEKITQ